MGVAGKYGFHRFPYREEEGVRNVATGETAYVPRPTLTVLVQHGDLSWRAKALVDTGAPLTIFDRGAGDALGIDFREGVGERRRIQIMGKEPIVQMAFVTLTLPPFNDLNWDAQVGFFLDELEIPFGLLGTEGFLDHWAVSFVEYKGYFTVEPIEEWEQRMGVDPFEEFQKLDHGQWERPRD